MLSLEGGLQPLHLVDWSSGRWTGWRTAWQLESRVGVDNEACDPCNPSPSYLQVGVGHPASQPRVRRRHRTKLGSRTWSRPRR